MSSCWDTNTESYENEEYTILWYVTSWTLVDIYCFWQICCLHLMDTVVGSRWRQQVFTKWHFSTRLYCISSYKTVFIATKTSSLTILMNGNISYYCYISCHVLLQLTPHPRVILLSHGMQRNCMGASYRSSMGNSYKSPPCGAAQGSSLFGL
jgi:hypothetical protein